MTSDLPFSQACENNRKPILEQLLVAFRHCHQILEIGSGTGQHAVYFAPRLPHLLWQTSDLQWNHAGINSWIDRYPAGNLLRPLVLDVYGSNWPLIAADGVFTANTCHIMPWPAVVAMFSGLEKIFSDGAVLVIYGPFKYGGRCTTDSNAQFDRWLRSQAPHQGIRDIEAITELAASIGLNLTRDQPMPANNQLLVFNRQPD